ncbi:CSS-motif domain-containing protein [Pseudomonas monteilii]
MHRLSAGRILLDLLLTLTISVIPIACGITMMVFQLEAKLSENAKVSLNEAIYAIDKVIDGLHDVSARALYLANRPCTETLPELNALASGNPMVRSLVLLRSEAVHCSSLRGTQVDQVDLKQLHGERVSLVFGAQSSPGRPVLAYSLDTGETGIIATAHGSVVSSELSGFQDQLILIVRIGEARVWAAGSSASETGVPALDPRGSQTSAKYGYTVLVGYPPGHLGQEVRLMFPTVLPSLLLVGLLTACVTYWSLYRKEREMRQALSRPASHEETV